MTVAESKRAILRMLHMMAFQILLAHQRYPGREMLSAYDRTPLNAPLMGDSKLTFLIVAPPVGVPAIIQLESGRFEFFHLAAATDQIKSLDWKARKAEHALSTSDVVVNEVVSLVLPLIDESG